MVIPDAEAPQRANDIRRVLVCSGKVYVDLSSSEHRATRPDVAICRLEQLYPVPMRDLRAMLDGYPATPRRSSGSRKSRRTWARGTSSVRT